MSFSGSLYFEHGESIFNCNFFNYLFKISMKNLLFLKKERKKRKKKNKKNRKER